MRGATIAGGVIALSAIAAGERAFAFDGRSAARPAVYRFSLDGKSLSPAVVSVTGRDGELAPGDLIAVDDIWLTVGEEGEYRFRSATEGVLLELGDGRSRWVAVRVGPHYGRGPDFVDGMAALTPDEVRGLWGVQAETWTRSCAAKAAFLDVSRVHLTLGQSGSEGHDSLPELPAGLRSLEAMRFVGWKNLRRLRHLRHLDVLPEDDFDARLIAGLEELRILRIFGGRLKHVEALAALSRLDTLDLRLHHELPDIGFAKSLARLRTLQIEGTGVRDLAPLSDLTHLETVDANRSRVERLPSGALPALKQLNVVGAPVTEQDVAAFRQAHPGVRVRRGWNESLRDALRGVTRLRLGPGAACGLEEPPPPYESTDAAEIAGLLQLLEVDEERSGALCGCLGGASFEFFSGDQLRETADLVCNSMLRWSGWPGDGELAPGNVKVLLDWLADRGVTGPRDEERASRAREEAFQRKSARAMAGWTPKLRESFERDGGASGGMPGSDMPRFFPAALSSEFPVRAERIRVLLRILGADTGSWSGLDWQEVMAEQLLKTYRRSELEDVCEAALRGTDRRLRRGAARFWDGWESPLQQWKGGPDSALRLQLLAVLQEAQSPDLRQRAVSRLASWWGELPEVERDRRLRAALQDPSEPVRQEAMLAAGRLQAAWAEDGLLHVLAGQTPAFVPPPPPPPDEVEAFDLSADRIGYGSAPSEGEVAALALGYLRSRRAQPLIEERAAASGSAMFRVARALFDERCDLLIGDDFAREDANQPLQLAAVESVVRCRGRHALDLAVGYEQATHWWEPEYVVGALKTMLLGADAPGADVLKKATTLPELRGWYRQYGAAYVEHRRAN